LLIVLVQGAFRAWKTGARWLLMEQRLEISATIENMKNDHVSHLDAVDNDVRYRLTDCLDRDIKTT
jgi:hypothetical protein